MGSTEYKRHGSKGTTLWRIEKGQKVYLVRLGCQLIVLGITPGTCMRRIRITNKEQVPRVVGIAQFIAEYGVRSTS